MCKGAQVAIRGVLLDFAGTLLVPVPREEWVTGALQTLGMGTTGVAQLAERLERAGRSGGPEPEQLPKELETAYATRDLSPASHRELYEALMAQVTGSGTQLTRQLYDDGTVGAGWVPYPDTLPLLRQLKDRRVKTAVVSNVGFGLRTVFEDHGLATYVDAFILSYEVGVMKPAPLIFEAACESLDIEKHEALMVGDSPTADSGAAAIGITTLLLPYTAPGAPHGLDTILRLL